MKNRAQTLFLALSLAGLTSLGLTGCGGGTQGEKFTPSNIVSFGDESSAFTSEVVGSGTIKGLKYTINDLAYLPGTTFLPALPTGATIDLADYPLFPLAPAVGATPDIKTPTTNSSIVTRVWTMDAIYKASGASTKTTQSATDVTYKYIYNCGDTSVSEANRLWIQILASSFGMSYSNDCALDTRGKAETFAAAGAKVADVVTQISSNMSKISGNTLVTVLAGQNDILEKFDALYLAGTPLNGAVASAESDLAVLGRTLGSAVNPIAATGARVLLVYVPDLSYSPKVVSDSAKAAVMNRLVRAFNGGIFSSGGARIDGSVIGLVDGYQVVRVMAQNPSAYALINVKDAACTAGRSIDTTSLVSISSVTDLKYCNDVTLPVAVAATGSTPAIPAATAYNYLWASDTLLTPPGHAQLAQAAFNRVDNDTF